MATAELSDETEVDENQLVIQNNKGVERLVIPIPAEGGVVVLTGDNGAGKTEALRAVRAALGSKDDRSDLRPSDDHEFGSVKGLGVTIKIGRLNRSSGELTVASLEDTLDISDLVDPGILDHNAADSSRVKALLKVAGAKGDFKLFEELLGDTCVIDSAVLKERDLVKQAAGVKKAIEAYARTEEGAAEVAATDSLAQMKLCDGVDLSAESDEAKLQAEYKAAVQLDTQIDQRLQAAERAEEAKREAEKCLAERTAEYKGPVVADAEVALAAARELETEQHDLVRKLEADLIAARSEYKLRQEQTKARESAFEAAQAHARTIESWREQIAREIPQAPTADEIDAATERLDKATKAVQQGAIVRRSLEAQAKANELALKSQKHKKLADQWRQKAKAVDEVLSQVIAGLGCPITVGEDEKGLRLMVNHVKRGSIYFSELSAGEKWATVIPIAINAVGEDGVFVLPQHAWEGLQPRIREAVISQLHGSRVTMITAQCADGAIRAEVAS